MYATYIYMLLRVNMKMQTLKAFSVERDQLWSLATGFVHLPASCFTNIAHDKSLWIYSSTDFLKVAEINSKWPYFYGGQ